ncbi:MAG: glycosyltransferase family 2 protein [Jiangellaceae bacterium]
MTGTGPLVSVVVPTRNSARTLEACLESVRAQKSEVRIETIVVDNDSTDGTWEIARRGADVAVRGGPERSAQRNLGVAKAHGEWVLWLDSDMLLPAGAVREALDTARREHVDAVALPECTVGTGFWTACRTLERSCYRDQMWMHNPRLLRRSTLTGIGGFDPAMAGLEDTDLRHRLRAAGVRWALAPVLVEHDEGHLTLGSVLAKRMYYGRSIPAFAAVNPGRVAEQGRATVRAFWQHRRRLGLDPVHAGGMIVLRAAEAGAYALGAWQGRHAGRSARADAEAG